MTSISNAAPVVITPSVLQGSLIGTITSDQASIANLENEAATGYSVTVASDNPAQAANILQLQASVARANQYATNAQDGLSWLTLANSTVNSVMTVLQSVESTVQSITGDAASGTASAIAGIATTVSGALTQLIDLANTQYGGQAIFSGTGNPTMAYSTTGVYVGAGKAPTRTVAPNTEISVSVTGTQIFGTGTTGLLSKVPGNQGILAQIVTRLEQGTSTSINWAATTGLKALQGAMSKVEAQAAKLGADQVAMQGFSSQATASATSLEGELSNAQDVNLAAALTNLQQMNSAYNAALYVTGQLSADSLVNYL